MGYCKNCGAYIPDGHTKCLACGLDNAENNNTASAAQTASAPNAHASQRIDTNKLKQQIEQQRQKQREYARKWAEAEKSRRQKAANEKADAEEGATTEPHSAKNASMPDFTAFVKRVPNKLFAVMSYFSILFAIPYIFCRDDEFSMFHAKQGFILFVVGKILDLIGLVIPFAWIAGMFRIYCVISGVVNAADGKKKKLPIIGDIF